jgi:hypothetical protein
MAFAAARVECSEPSIGTRIRLNMVEASQMVARVYQVILAGRVPAS